jgi:hypothetical protein
MKEEKAMGRHSPHISSQREKRWSVVLRIWNYMLQSSCNDTSRTCRIESEKDESWMAFFKKFKVQLLQKHNRRLFELKSVDSDLWVFGNQRFAGRVSTTFFTQKMRTTTSITIKHRTGLGESYKRFHML